MTKKLFTYGPDFEITPQTREDVEKALEEKQKAEEAAPMQEKETAVEAAPQKTRKSANKPAETK